MSDLLSILERLLRQGVDFVLVGGQAAIVHGATVKERSIEVDLPIGKCRVLALEALMEAKRAMGRPVDQVTLVQLRAIQDRPRVDG